jgi:hypothetical protein
VCQIIDVHFQQWVDGCLGYKVAVNERSWLKITQLAGPPAPVMIYIANNLCAVIKDPQPIEKVSQVPSFNGDPVEKGDLFLSFLSRGGRRWM